MALAFIFITILIIWPVVFYIKKSLPWDVLYTNVMFGLFVQNLTDAYASFRYQSWGFFDVKNVEYTSLLVIFGIYPAFSILIINGFPYKDRWVSKATYLLAWSIFSTLYEWIAVWTGIIWHIHWNLIFSFFLYPAVYYLLILQVRLHLWIKRLPDNQRKRGC